MLVRVLNLTYTIGAVESGRVTKSPEGEHSRLRRWVEEQAAAHISLEHTAFGKESISAYGRRDVVGAWRQIISRA